MQETINIKRILKKYRTLDMVNQSAIKLALENYTSLELNPVKKSSDKPHFIVGNAFDAYNLFGADFFNACYAVIGDIPGDGVVNVFDKCINNIELKIGQDFSLNNYYRTLSPSFDTLQEEIYEAAVEFNYRGTWGREAVMKELKKSENYFATIYTANFGEESRGLLSKSDFGTILAMDTGFATSSQFKEFDEKADKFYPYKYNQLILLFEFMGIQCKALLDTAHMNFTESAAMIVDVKSTQSRTYNFHYDVEKFRYDIQAMWYTIGLMSGGTMIDSRTGNNYSYAPFNDVKFFWKVASKREPHVPAIYKCSNSTMLKGFYGISVAEDKVIGDFNLSRLIHSDVQIEKVNKSIKYGIKHYVLKRQNLLLNHTKPLFTVL